MQTSTAIVLFALLGYSIAATIPNFVVPIVPFHQSLVSPGNVVESRIANGHPATENQFAYQVSVRAVVGAGQTTCGGSLISPSWVLTAAHCTVGQTQFNLRFGSINLASGGITQTVFSVINHPSYNPVNLNNDLALIPLTTAVPLSAAVQPIRLPTASQASHTFHNYQTIVSGWGETAPGAGVSGVLRWVAKRVITNDECASVYGTSPTPAHVVCTRGYTSANQGACGGDSGGPLVLVEGGVSTQVGVVAFAASAALGGCTGGHPNGYMRTASFLGWINQHTGIAIRQ